MADHEAKKRRQIGVLAEEAGTSTDTDLGRLRFIRRAKHLGFSLSEIRELLSVAQEGQCPPLWRQMTELLARKIAACEAQLAELAHLTSSLEARYQLALDYLDEPACQCAAFPATCGCLPAPPMALQGQQ